MITFKKIRFKNLFSFGDEFVEFNFSEKIVLVHGENGSGKSAAILDSLSFGLFNKPFRKITKPELINKINKQNLIVEIWFEKPLYDGNDEFHIVRCLNPQKFEI